jgi:hypothetical protein
MQKLTALCLLGLTGFEVQNKTKQEQTNFYPLFQLKNKILLICYNFFKEHINPVVEANI